VVDALDEASVDAHADAIVAAAGSLDVSLNVISHGDVQGTPRAEMTLADFEAPVHAAIRNHVPDHARGRAPHDPAGLRVTLVFGGHGDPMRDHHLGGLQVAFQAQEALRRNLAAELGPDGIRASRCRRAGCPSRSRRTSRRATRSPR
jgi:3-oxoacyl-[acyl-carrier protein] reductase